MKTEQAERALEKDNPRVTIARLFSHHLDKGTTPEQLHTDIINNVGVDGVASVLGLKTVRSILTDMSYFGTVSKQGDIFKYSGIGENKYV